MPLDGLLRGRYVALEADRGVLHEGDGVAVLGEPVVDGTPTGAVDEAAVDEDDVGGGRGHGDLVSPMVTTGV
jgi:hypothetical protein